MSRRDEGGGQPVLLLNPTTTEEQMARRKRSTRKRTTRRRTTSRRRAPARRATTTRRRRRRKKNPSPDIKGTGMAALAGAAVGGGAYALEGTELSKMYQAGIMAGGGLVLGMIASMYSKTAGAGLAAAGLAIGTKIGLDAYMTNKATAQGMYGLGMGAVRAPLGATQWNMAGTQWNMAGAPGMGAVEVPLG